MGSRIALEIAFKHPEVVNTLILCSPNPGGEHQAQRKTDAYARLTAKDLSHKEALATIRRPTLVVGGLSDVLDQPENIHTVACRIPFAWSAYFPGAGHDFLSQDYKDFAELVILFIEANKSYS